jgi:ComF family protein
VVRVLRSPIDILGCTLLPGSCTLCGSPLPQISRVPICDVCWTEFSVLAGPACARCGDLLDQFALRPGTQPLCRACRLAPPPFVRAVAFGLYDGRMKAAIHALKYDRLQSAARELGNRLANAIGQIEPDAPSEMLVVPVPLHRSRHSQRGFNQARVLASHALKSLARSHPAWRLTLADRALVRQRATVSQAGLSPRQRRLNLRGAFVVTDPVAVNGKDVLMIDDILTTGATARAVSSALLNAGAASVWVATLARARRRFSGTFDGSIREEEIDFRGAGQDENPQTERMHSSVNQPSF